MRTNELKIRLPKKHPGQRSVTKDAERFNVINCGRRWGKTLLGTDLTVKPLLSGYEVGWYSPTYKSLADVWRIAKRIYQPVILSKSEQEKRLEVVGGGVLEMWSLEDPDSSRGRRYKRIIVDEAAKARHLEEAWTYVIRATLADYLGDAWFLSTPKGLNYFYTLFNFGISKRTGWSSWTFPTYVNPFIRKSEIDEMRIDLPERVFQQEILAEFLSDGAYFQNIENAAIIDVRDDPKNHVGHGLYLGIDWALENDFTVLTLGCSTCNRIVDWDRFNQIQFTYQRERVMIMYNRWKPAGILAERNSIGEPNIEIFTQAGLPMMLGSDGKPGFYTSATTKPGLIQTLAVGLEHDGFLVPVEAAHELRIYEVEQMPSGHPKFSAPDNQNDDWVISLGLTRMAMVGGGWWIL